MTQPMPDPTSPFWEGLQENTIKLQECQDCETVFFPPGHVCPECSSHTIHWITDSGQGTLYSFTRQHNTAPGFEAPLIIGLLELDAGPRILTQIDAAYDALEINDRMQLTATEYDQDYHREYRADYPFFSAVPVSDIDRINQ